VVRRGVPPARTGANACIPGWHIGSDSGAVTRNVEALAVSSDLMAIIARRSGSANSLAGGLVSALMHRLSNRRLDPRRVRGRSPSKLRTPSLMARSPSPAIGPRLHPGTRSERRCRCRGSRGRRDALLHTAEIPITLALSIPSPSSPPMPMRCRASSPISSPGVTWSKGLDRD
jgi:hypothetical protein